MGTVDDRHRQASAVYKVEPLKVAMFDIYDAILLAVVIGYLIWCPYTKVEESFNIQAMHDMLFYGTEIDKVRFSSTLWRSMQHFGLAFTKFSL